LTNGGRERYSCQVIRDPGFREPWQQRADEREADYLDFVRWLHASPRPIPAGQQRALAYDWAGRARAFDQALTERDQDPITAARENLRLILALETHKMLRECQGNPARGMTTRETIELGKVLLALRDVAPGTWDQSAWTDEDIEIAERLLFGRRSA
jgi:hypothetical protein